MKLLDLDHAHFDSQYRYLNIQIFKNDSNLIVRIRIEYLEEKNSQYAQFHFNNRF